MRNSDTKKLLLLGLAAFGLIAVFASSNTSKESATFQSRALAAPKATNAPKSNPPRVGETNTPQFKSLAQLAQTSSSKDALLVVAAVQSELLSHKDGAVAAAALLNFLENGDDIALETPLQIAAEGELKSASTTRVALLDLLGQLDSSLAAEYSRRLLESSTSSDEWAIALRNYAWGVDSAATDPFIRTKVLELLTNPSWIAAPTAGFLEAFDFVPYTKDSELVAPLTYLTKAEQPPSVRRAALFALERFVSAEPEAGLLAISQAEASERFSPLRADTMARANLARPPDLQIVKSYLLSSQIDPKEYQIFAKLFPHGGQFAGASLATRFKPNALTDLAQQDRQAFSVLQSWLNDAAFSARRSELTQILNRLAQLNESAVKGGYL